MQTTRELVEALAYLYNAREMQTVRTWLRAAANDEAVRAVKDNENVDVNRGRAQVLLELSQLFDNAPREQQRLETRTNGSAKQSQPRYT